jgi:hypothetical protein
MNDYPHDIYAEARNIDVHTLNNLGPLRRMAGIWQGQRGLDVKPKAEGPKQQAFIETLSMQPIDPVSNGPQLLYGLRYHTHITKPEQIKTYHEPATQTIIHTLTIPRGLIAMACGQAAPDAQQFELQATQGLDTWGICSTPFLNRAFKTTAFTIRVSFQDDGSWSYEEDSVLQIQGQPEAFHHTDRNRLYKIAEAEANPLAHN